MSEAPDFRIRKYDVIASTNDIIKQAIADLEPEGLVVCARAQTQGYGRRGNAWSSSPGGLYMSILLRPPCSLESLQTLPLITAISVVRALSCLTKDENKDSVKIKWPNDVVIVDEDAATAEPSPFRKICGISAEQKQGAVCLGIGINIKPPENQCDFANGQSTVCRSKAQEFPYGNYSMDGTDGGADPNEHETPYREDAFSNGRNKPAFLDNLASGKVNIETVRAEVLKHFSNVYEIWAKRGFLPFLDEFERSSALTGRIVCIEEAGGSRGVCGKVAGITEEGLLIIEDPKTGMISKISAGTVSLKI